MALLGLGLALLVTFLPQALLAAPEKISIRGFIAARGLHTEGQASWLEGGFGQLASGGGGGQGEGADDSTTTASGQFHLVLDAEFAHFKETGSLGVYVHGLARAEPDVVEGRAAGIVEAFVHATIPLRESDSWRFQLGLFILPTSRENVEVAWSSPYTITFSALNTWIGEEIRPQGALSEYTLAVGPVAELRFGASLFGGNDAAGALLAWRGWSLGDRISTFGETLPLPPLPSLAPGGAFVDQLDRGSQPLGSDLDSRLGWAGYLKYVRPQQAVLQWSRYDNRGDRQLHNGDEYSWTTEFDLFGFEVHSTPGWSLVGEYMNGSTGMGLVDRAHVQLDFRAAYLLTSWRSDHFRLTLRYDKFETTDRDLTGASNTHQGLLADNNDGDGRAWTLAFFWEPTDSLRLGLELLDVEGQRPEAATSGFDPNTDGRSMILGLRYYFGG